MLCLEKTNTLSTGKPAAQSGAAGRRVFAICLTAPVMKENRNESHRTQPYLFPSLILIT